MNVPKVFVSYSHESDAHKAWVRKLATDLRGNGVDAILDQWDLAPGQDVSLFMQRGVADSDRVIMVCSEAYVGKADGATGGVSYERLIITGEVVGNIDTKKFIPVIRGNASARKVPQCIGPRLYIDFTRDAEYAAKLEELLHELHDFPVLAKPPVVAPLGIRRCHAVAR